MDVKYKEVIVVIEDLEFCFILNWLEDELGVVFEINVGVGGIEVCDWVDMLFRMYKMWGEKKGFKLS